MPRAVRQGGWSVRGPARPAGEGSQRLALAAALGVTYAGVMVGRVPFWAASSLFVFAFITVFEWNAEPERRVRRVVEAAAIGAGTGLAVTLVFEELFLLRLP